MKEHKASIRPTDLRELVFVAVGNRSNLRERPIGHCKWGRVAVMVDLGGERELRWLSNQIDVALGEGKPWAEQCAKLIEQAQALLLRNAEPDSLGFCTKRTSALAGTLEDVALMVRGE